MPVSLTVNVAAIQELADRVRANIARAVIGNEREVELLLVALLSEGHVLLEDVPGTGKTTLARALASSFDCAFRRIQFTPDLLSTDVTGLSYFNQKLGEFVFRAGPIFTNILLADEINRATPRTQSALLEAMQERTVTIDGETRQLARPFLVLATQNPVELEGTFPLPEAQLDRFLLRMSLGYPSLEHEIDVLSRYERNDPLAELSPVATAQDLLTIRQAVRQIHLSDPVRRYIVELVHSTRNHADILLGASPRASIALHRASQAYAALKGRDYVQPDDIKLLAEPVLSHRLILQTEARLRGRSAQNLVQHLLDTLAVPVE